MDKYDGREPTKTELLEDLRQANACITLAIETITSMERERTELQAKLKTLMAYNRHERKKAKNG